MQEETLHFVLKVQEVFAHLIEHYFVPVLKHQLALLISIFEL